MESQLTFGADCVLTLEDIGQLKDYTEAIEKLMDRMTTAGIHVGEWLPELLQLTKAEPEDIYYLPVFVELLKLLIRIDWTQQQIGRDQLCRLIQFQLLLVEECLLSPTLGEEALLSLVKKCEKYKKYSQFHCSLMWMLFRLSDKVVYIEEVDSTSLLWAYLDEEMVFTGPSLQNNHHSNQAGFNHINIKIAAYLETCEKFARNSKIRQSLRGLPHQKWIIKARLAVTEGNSMILEECKERLSKMKFFGSEFLESMLSSWQAKVSQ